MKGIRAIVALLVVGTAGCNCHGDRVCTLLTSSTSSSTTGTPATPSTPASATGSAAGIWRGSDSATGLGLTGFVTSTGHADFIRSDGVQFVGTAQVSGTALTIALQGYTQYGYQFSDGSTFGSGTLSGTLSSGSSITASLQFTTASNTSLTASTWSLTFDSLYNTASSLPAISGTYTDSLAGVSHGTDPLQGAGVTISSNSAMYAQGSSNNCVLSGSVNVLDTGSDLYQVSYTLNNCSGAAAVLNNVQFTGLAELDTGASPAVVIAVTGNGTTGTHYGIVSDLSAG
jgi:hypothetical protein